jgi:hypothetical protein
MYLAQGQMVQEIYAITSNLDAIRKMRENVTNYLEPCFDGRREDHGLLYYLTPVGGTHPCVRVSAERVEFVGTELAFDAIVPLPNCYTICEAA